MRKRSTLRGENVSCRPLGQRTWIRSMLDAAPPTQSAAAGRCWRYSWSRCEPPAPACDCRQTRSPTRRFRPGSISFPAERLDLPSGATSVKLNYEGGVSLVVPTTSPLLGRQGQAIKIIDVKLGEDIYTIEANVRPEFANTVQLLTQRKVMSAQGATVTAMSNGRYEFAIHAPSLRGNASEYRRTTVSVKFSPMH